MKPIRFTYPGGLRCFAYNPNGTVCKANADPKYLDPTGSFNTCKAHAGQEFTGKKFQPIQRTLL